MNRPFGVRKNRRSVTDQRLRRGRPADAVTAASRGLDALQRRCHQQSPHAVPFEQAKPVLAAEHERGGRERVGDHRRRRDDRHARERRGGLAGARVEDVVTRQRRSGSPLRSRPRCTRRVFDTRSVSMSDSLARMPDADGPRLAVRVAPAEVEIAAGIDREIRECASSRAATSTASPLATAPRSRTSGLMQRDGRSPSGSSWTSRQETARVEAVSGVVRRSPVEVVAVESARLHAPARPSGRRRRHSSSATASAKRIASKSIGLTGTGRADMLREPAEFARGIEPAAALLDALEPAGGTRHAFGTLGTLSVRLLRARRPES